MPQGVEKVVAVITLGAVLVTGCTAAESNPKTAIGAAGGATVGGQIKR